MNICLVIALLSLVPAKKILLREIPHAFANLPMKRFVSQFVSVMLAAVNLPLGSKLIFVEISSTLKSAILALSNPPIPDDSTAYPIKPIESANPSLTDMC